MSGHDEALVEKAAEAIGEWLFRMHGTVSSCDHKIEARAVLDAVTNDLRAEGWDRGYTSGHSNAMRRMSDEPDAPTTPNPYRATGGVQ